jgi:hypothetical protein
MSALYSGNQRTAGVPEADRVRAVGVDAADGDGLAGVRGAAAENEDEGGIRGRVPGLDGVELALGGGTEEVEDLPVADAAAQLLVEGDFGGEEFEVGAGHEREAVHQDPGASEHVTAGDVGV